MNLDNAVSIATPLIAGFEGFSSKAYYDVNGYAIGYGNHYYGDGSSVKAGDTIDKATATSLLQSTIRDYANQILPSIKVDITDNQMASLISLSYNCGPGAVKNSKVLQLINAGAPADQIEAQYKTTCVTAAGKYNEDLVIRRGKEALAWATTFVQQNKTWIIIVIGAIAAGLVFYYTYRIEKA
jgi:GH24 family phage-related lysozyme (muramidase)